jgi:hypothetical protein
MRWQTAPGLSAGETFGKAARASDERAERAKASKYNIFYRDGSQLLYTK